MRFPFHKEESKIIDLIAFPGMLYAEENAKTGMDDWEDIVEEDTFEFIRICENAVSPYSIEIERLYSKNPMDFHDFASLIEIAYPVFGFRKAEDYLEFLLKIEEKDLKKRLVSAILDKEKKGEDKESEETEILSLDPAAVTELIKRQSVDSSSKWNLFLMMEEPKKYLHQYVQLLYDVLPAFEKIYSKHEEEIISCGRRLEARLNDNDAKEIEDITISMVKPEMLAEGENVLLVSLMKSYSLEISIGGPVPHLVWGLGIESAFQKIKEKRENKLNGRIQVFKNLGDKTRYEVLRLIANGETSIKNIATTLSVSSATISYHISALINSDILKYTKKEGKIGYELNRQLIDEVFKGLLEDLKEE